MQKKEKKGKIINIFFSKELEQLGILLPLHKIHIPSNFGVVCQHRADRSH